MGSEMCIRDSCYPLRYRPARHLGRLVQPAEKVWLRHAAVRAASFVGTAGENSGAGRGRSGLSVCGYRPLHRCGQRRPVRGGRRDPDPAQPDPRRSPRPGQRLAAGAAVRQAVQLRAGPRPAQPEEQRRRSDGARSLGAGLAIADARARHLRRDLRPRQNRFGDRAERGRRSGSGRPVASRESEIGRKRELMKGRIR